MQEAICPGTDSASSRSRIPLSVTFTMTTRSSVFERLRDTYPFSSRLLSSGVNVPESRNSLPPRSFMDISLSSHRTIIAMYWVYVRSRRSSRGRYLLTTSLEQAYRGKQSWFSSFRHAYLSSSMIQSSFLMSASIFSGVSVDP